MVSLILWFIVIFIAFPLLAFISLTLLNLIWDVFFRKY